MRRFSTALVLALALPVTVAHVVAPVAVADTVSVDDAFDDLNRHHVRDLVVDNTGDVVGATVRHVAEVWTGSVELRFDVGGGPRAEFLAVLQRGSAQRDRFSTVDGSNWPCAERLAGSLENGGATQLTAPRSCFDGAATLRVRAFAAVGDDVDRVSSAVVAQQSRPNVILVMLDDMRADDLAYMPLTRELIADQGVTFANSLAPYPLCCPARASLLTGQYAHNHRVWSHKEPYGFSSFDDRSTLATWLQDAGYATAYVGKYLNGYGTMPEPGAETGRSTTYVPPGWTDWRGSIDGGLPAGHPERGSTYNYMNTTLSDNGVEFDNYEGQHQSRVYGELSEQVVTERAASDQPFFFYVSYTAPHHGGPRDPDDPEPVIDDAGREQRFATPFVPADVRGSLDDAVVEAPGADWFRDQMPRDKPEYLRNTVPMNAAENAAALELSRQRAESVQVVDQQVARMIRALARTGELEETLIMLTSDNGYFLGEQGIRAGKTLPHEPAIRTPLVMRGPGIPAGETRYDPFLSIDFAPTIARLARVTPTSPVDGTSLLSVARNGDRGWTRAVLTETGQRNIVRETDEAGEPLPAEDPGLADIRYAIGVRSDRYLYTHLANGDEELYDMAVDPDQYDNLVNIASYAPVLELMRTQMQKIRACDGTECRAQLPVPLQSDPGESIVNGG